LSMRRPRSNFLLLSSQFVFTFDGARDVRIRPEGKLNPDPNSEP
jgi:hypothetical protein